MILSCAFAPRPGVEDLIARAEALGYARAWLGDSPLLYGDVWMSLALAAAKTSRIGLGPAVLIPSLRHVAVTAAAIAHLEALAPGRVAVALGTGFTGRRMFGKPPLRWSELAGSVRALRGLLAGETVEVDGAPLRLLQPAGYAAPRPISVPLLLAAGGARGLAMAAELADGVICASVVPPGAKDAVFLTLGTVLDEGEPADAPRVVETLGPALAVVLHGTYEAAGAAVDGLPGGRAWREAIEAFPERERGLRVHEGHLAELTDRDRASLSPALVGTTFTGSRAALRERIAGLEAQGVRELAYFPLGASPERELERMAEAFAR